MTREQIIESIRHSLDTNEATNAVEPIDWDDWSDYELRHWYNEIHHRG